MKNLLVLFALIPCLSFAQVKKVSIGGILIESFDQHLVWSQDFRLTANLNLKKTNHHLVVKKHTLQASNALEFKWGEPYIFASHNFQTHENYLGLGIQKGISTQFGSVVFFTELGTSFPKPSISFGFAIHPQLTIYKKSP